MKTSRTFFTASRSRCSFSMRAVTSSSRWRCQILPCSALSAMSSKMRAEAHVSKLMRQPASLPLPCWASSTRLIVSILMESEQQHTPNTGKQAEPIKFRQACNTW